MNAALWFFSAALILNFCVFAVLVVLDIRGHCNWPAGASLGEPEETK